MDGCSSWLPFLGVGIGDDGASSMSASEGQHKQDPPISSQVEEQLQQIYLLMDMEKNGHPEPEVAGVPSSASSMFPSFSGSPDETSSLKPRSSNNTTANSFHHPAPAEVSSLQIQLSPVTYSGGRHYDHQCYGNDLDMILNLDEFKCQEAHNERSQHKNGRAGAFMPYARHLSPKKTPNKPGSGGQRAIKAAMSAMARMHMVRLAQWRQCYQMEMAVAPAPPTGSSNCKHQQQHVLLERKRREKLNDSFKALMKVLPPASKKDKASILIRARDYVTTLESRVSELEAKNRMLVELQHRCNNGGDPGDVSGQKTEVDIDINREACVVKETSQDARR